MREIHILYNYPHHFPNIFEYMHFIFKIYKPHMIKIDLVN